MNTNLNIHTFEKYSLFKETKMVTNKKKVLAIGAHSDDVEIGCGGSLLKWKNQGYKITIFTACKSGYQDSKGNIIRSDDIAHSESIKASKFLGANLINAGFPTFKIEFSELFNSKLINVLANVQPDIVLTQWVGDTHHDHYVVAMASLHCCRHISNLLMYCSNWYESSRHFKPKFFVDISEEFEKKIELINIYQSENKRTDGIWLDYLQAQSKLYGLKTGVKYAEGFEIVKWLY